MLLRGGLVADGLGDAARRADVLTDGPVIAAVEPVAQPPEGCEVIDLAPGSVVCPGFIDAHVHAEGQLLAAGVVTGALAQGVTTLVVGQDGQSWIGASAATARYLSSYFGPVNGGAAAAGDAPGGGLTVAGYRDAVAGRLMQNVAVLASQGTIRHNVAGLSPRPLDSAQAGAARREVEQALAAGAAGLSSGFDYLPSTFGGVAEIAEMAAPLAAAGRPYVSHLRGYGARVGPGLAELVAVGRRAGVRVHASHLWGPPADIDAACVAADAAGVALSYDMYPYRRSSTILASMLLPASLQAGGPGQTLAALTDSRQRALLLAGEKFTGDFLGTLYLASLPGPLAEFAGWSVTEAAAGSGQPAGEWVLDLLVKAELNVGANLFRPELTGGELAWICAGDRHCAGSDGIYLGQHPHPRGYGAFARLAGQYLAGAPGAGNDLARYQVLARHLATTAADVYGLADRGRLAPGLAADICVIGPGGITETASDGEPRRLAAGVDLVLVNGDIAWRDGQQLPGRPGAVVS
jgi:N-acyl-D-amino-acid deacylase